MFNHPEIDGIFPELYDQLRGIANRYLRDEKRKTLRPTELVHEAYLRLSSQRSGPLTDRAYVIAAGAGIIRRVLLDHARKRSAVKRVDGLVRVTLTPELKVVHADDVDIESIHNALKHLAELDPRQAQVVELRFFGGLTMSEIAQIVNVSKRTVEEDWSMARAWLHRELSQG